MAGVNVQAPPTITVGTDMQYRTIFLILLVVGLEVLRSSAVKGALAIENKSSIDHVTWQKILVYLFASVLLVAFSEVAPSFVTWLLLLIILGVVVMNGDVYAAELGKLSSLLSGGKTA